MGGPGFELGSFSEFPLVVHAMDNQHTLCGYAFDCGLSGDAPIGAWSKDGYARRATCAGCCEIICRAKCTSVPSLASRLSMFEGE